MQVLNIARSMIVPVPVAGVVQTASLIWTSVLRGLASVALDALNQEQMLLSFLADIVASATGGQQVLIAN
eukprot:SAG31_NODE_27348_length_427_cov_1.024390_1_plen_69_part_01